MTLRNGTWAVLFTDIVDSTEQRARLGDEQGDALRREHDAAVARGAVAHDGHLIKGTGDGAMVAFPGAADAVAAAITIAQGIELRNRAASEALQVRIGISVGDLVYEDGDLHGLAANEAARLCAAAGRGEIMVSDTVRVIAGSRAACGLLGPETVHLKGLPEPISVWRVDWQPVPGNVISDHRYVLQHADATQEHSRLQSLEHWLDPITASRLAQVGVGEGWTCLEVGAGAGSMTRWLSDRVGPSGRVVAADIEPKFLVDLPSNVEVWRHDIDREGFDAGWCDLVYARSVLVHLTDPRSGLARMLDAAAPGGWLVFQENDLSVLAFGGSPDAHRATAVFHKIVSRWAAAGVMDAYLGHRLPGLVQDLGLESFGVDATVAVGRPGDAAFEVLRLGWSGTRSAAAAVGLDEGDLAVLDHIFESPDTTIVTMTLFTTWGRKPQ